MVLNREVRKIIDYANEQNRRNALFIYYRSGVLSALKYNCFSPEFATQNIKAINSDIENGHISEIHVIERVNKQTMNTFESDQFSWKQSELKSSLVVTKRFDITDEQYLRITKYLLFSPNSL